MAFSKYAASELHSDSDIGHLFVPADSPMPNDYMDIDSDDTKEDARLNDQMRSDWKEELDRDNADPDASPEDNPGQSEDTTYKRSAKNPIVAAVIRQRPNTILGAKVVLENKNARFMGKVLAVGDVEFATHWSDGSVTIERKSNYSLYH